MRETRRREPGPDGNILLCEICLGNLDRGYQAHCGHADQTVEMCLRDQTVRDTTMETPICPHGLTTVAHNLQEIGLLGTMTTTEIGLLALICVVLSLTPSQFYHSYNATPRTLVTTLRIAHGRSDCGPDFWRGKGAGDDIIQASALPR